jgi:hypothetical protein
LKDMSRTIELIVRISADLKLRIATVAEKQGVSINQMAIYMFTKEMHDLEAKRSLPHVWGTNAKRYLRNVYVYTR